MFGIKVRIVTYPYIKGSIPLKMCGQIQAVDYKKKKWCFEMQTPERNYHLCAQSEKDMRACIALFLFIVTYSFIKDWIEVLRATQEEVKGGSNTGKKASNGNQSRAVCIPMFCS